MFLDQFEQNIINMRTVKTSIEITFTSAVLNLECVIVMTIFMHVFFSEFPTNPSTSAKTTHKPDGK
jgi:hypothetical protein